MDRRTPPDPSVQEKFTRIVQDLHNKLQAQEQRVMRTWGTPSPAVESIYYRIRRLTEGLESVMLAYRTNQRHAAAMGDIQGQLLTLAAECMLSLIALEASS